MADTRSTSDVGPLPETYFAGAARSSPGDLRRSLQRLHENDFLDTVMKALGGWVAVLNANRQVLAVNHTLLRELGIDDPETILGLRPGEMLHCAHAADHPGGCGTSRFCATCGAAIAMVAAQESGETQQRECVITAAENGSSADHDFAVGCCPFEMEGEKLLLLTMREVSDEKRRAALERVFLHDLSNVLTAVNSLTQVLAWSPAEPRPDVLEQLLDTAAILAQEVKVQKLLAQSEPEGCDLDLKATPPSAMLHNVEKLFTKHPAAKGQALALETPADDSPLRTDAGLLTRVLTNMVLNAFEAGRPGDRVRVWCETDNRGVTFCVWNREAIPEPVVPRVFQRYFSTKSGTGRGMGTYAMKLIGEQLLGGQATFQTSPADGTVFRFHLPRQT